MVEGSTVSCEEWFWDASFFSDADDEDGPADSSSFIPSMLISATPCNIHNHNNSASRETDDSPTIYPSSTEDVGVDSFDRTKKKVSSFTFSWNIWNSNSEKYRKKIIIWDLWSLIHPLCDNSRFSLGSLDHTTILLESSSEQQSSWTTTTWKTKKKHPSVSWQPKNRPWMLLPTRLCVCRIIAKKTSGGYCIAKSTNVQTIVSGSSLLATPSRYGNAAWWEMLVIIHAHANSLVSLSLI